MDLLKDLLSDSNPMVRDTAVCIHMCVASVKVGCINALLVEDQGFLDLLKDLLSDSNPMVSWYVCSQCEGWMKQNA